VVAEQGSWLCDVVGAVEERSSSNVASPTGGRGSAFPGCRGFSWLRSGRAVEHALGLVERAPSPVTPRTGVVVERSCGGSRSSTPFFLTLSRATELA
jgi:hypothetical protein